MCQKCSSNHTQLNLFETLRELLSVSVLAALKSHVSFVDVAGTTPVKEGRELL